MANEKNAAPANPEDKKTAKGKRGARLPKLSVETEATVANFCAGKSWLNRKAIQRALRAKLAAVVAEARERAERQVENAIDAFGADVQAKGVSGMLEGGEGKK